MNEADQPPLKYTGVSGRDQLISVWPEVAPILIRAIRVYNEHSLEEIFESLLLRERQLWISGREKIGCVLITRILNGHEKKTCLIELYAGNGIESMKFFDDIETWAKNLGCNHMRLSGRKGWQRLLKDYDLKKIILEKEL